MRRSVAALCLSAAAAAASAQLASATADWQEAPPPPPPALKAQRLIPIAMPGSNLRWGVDPASITIGPDGVVRYVVVAAGPSAVNGIYEGVRCGTGEVKAHMRHSGDQWHAVSDPDWKPLHGNGAARHSLTIARTGACLGHAPNRSAEQVARDLAADPEHRFRPEVR